MTNVTNVLKIVPTLTHVGGSRLPRDKVFWPARRHEVPVELSLGRVDIHQTSVFVPNDNWTPIIISADPPGSTMGSELLAALVERETNAVG